MWVKANIMSTIKENFMTKDEALKMAIETMESTKLGDEAYGLAPSIILDDTINACKEALERPAQDYVLICKRCGDDLGLKYVPDEPEDPLCKICGKVLGSTKECAWTGCPLNWGDEASEKRQDIIGQNGNVGYGEGVDG